MAGQPDSSLLFRATAFVKSYSAKTCVGLICWLGLGLSHGFFGINVDQWVFARPGEAEVSVFLRDGRIVARAVGRDVPQDLFRVDLPSPPKPESEGRTPTPRLGMMASDIATLYGPVKYRVDYVVNGQAASRVVFELRGKGTFAGITFVDGVATGLEDLGRFPDDPIFQGR